MAPDAGRRPVVALMCAPIAAGKTTVASALQRHGFVRVSVDAAAFARGWTGVITRQQAQELDIALRAELDQLLTDGRDVVLDYSLSTRAVRDEYRTLVQPRGVPVVVFVDTPIDIALARLARRRDAHADDVTMSDAEARRYHEGFEVPASDEGALVTVAGSRPVDVDVLVARIRSCAGG